LRGQTAIEYMMTYGWAILVVLAIGIVIWQMGFFDLSKNVQHDKRGFSQVTVMDWRLAENGGLWNLTVIVQNNAGTLIDIQGAPETAANVLQGGSGSCTLAGAFPVDDFRPASVMRISFSSCPMQNDLQVGDYYRVNLTIGYQNPASGLPHLSNGIIWGPAG